MDLSVVKNWLEGRVYRIKHWCWRTRWHVLGLQTRFIDKFAEKAGGVWAHLNAHRHVCTHESIAMVEGDVHPTRYGYDYLVVHLRCRDCPSEWKVQGRTPGKFSSRPAQKTFTDASGL
jgi:hypothetical protein